MAGGLVTGIFRGIQILGAAVVLGLSVALAKGQEFGKVPASTSYAAFVGAWALLVAFIGIVAIFIQAIPSLIVAGMDGLASLLLIAGGIAFAVQLRGIECANPARTFKDKSLSYPGYYSLVNGGTTDQNCGESETPTCIGVHTWGALQGRCEMAEADTVFLFIALIACVVVMALGVMAHKRGGGRHTMV